MLILCLRNSIGHQHQRIAGREMELHHSKICLLRHTDWQGAFHFHLLAIQIRCQMPRIRKCYASVACDFKYQASGDRPGTT
jgi:hypothetical protein